MPLMVWILWMYGSQLVRRKIAHLSPFIAAASDSLLNNHGMAQQLTEFYCFFLLLFSNPLESLDKACICVHYWNESNTQENGILLQSEQLKQHSDREGVYGVS